MTFPNVTFSWANAAEPIRKVPQHRHVNPAPKSHIVANALMNANPTYAISRPRSPQQFCYEITDIDMSRSIRIRKVISEKTKQAMRHHLQMLHRINNGPNIGHLPPKENLLFSYEEEDEVSNIEKEYAQLEEKYNHLMEGIFVKSKKRTYIQPANQPIRGVQDVGMDCFKLIDATHGTLGTSGVASCFCLCAVGKTHTLRTKLGLLHMSSLIEPKEGLKFLKSKMIKSGCIKKELKLYIIGGQVNDPTDPDAGTLETAKALLKRAKKYNVMEVRVNRSAPEQGLQVVLTANKLYYNMREILFPVDIEGVGESLFDAM